MTASRRPWVVVLAGGDGRRLDGTLVHGQLMDRPKQFCRPSGAQSLLERTLVRAGLITEPQRVVTALREEHRGWWQDAMRPFPAENILAQSANRGTAVAILHALVHILERDPEPTLVVLPSDHAASEETVLVESIRRAARLARRNPEDVLLLGMTAESAEVDYGWILPRGADARRVREVVRFIEKPPPTLAVELRSAGGLWNSFILASSGRALFALIENSQPLLTCRYLEYLLASRVAGPAVRAPFRALPCVDFGRDVLEKASTRLGVVTVPPCGWLDLGTPVRLARWVEQDDHHGPLASAGRPTEDAARQSPEGRVSRPGTGSFASSGSLIAGPAAGRLNFATTAESRRSREG